MKKPNCKKCPSTCKYGGWTNSGFCGAQHITHSMKECGTYHFHHFSKDGSPVYKCNNCIAKFKA